jgi:uncharacterized repeat protein (TIGR04052 family)
MSPKKCFLLFSVWLILMTAWSTAQGQTTQPVILRFAGAVNGEPFACGKSYPNIGTTKSTITPSDFRLFISAIELLTTDGKVVTVALDQDGIWQYKNVALVDFEDGSGPCGNGTKAIHTEVTGTVPAGSYTGVRFTMGVPFEVNHGDPTVAPSPLNITAMFWNWQGGYKFLRTDMATTGLAKKPAMKKMAMEHGVKGGHGQHGVKGGHGQDDASGYSIHLGSTMCASPSPTESPSSCKNPNRVTVTFAKFDAAKNTVIADLGAILAGANVDHNTPDTSPGCMSFPKDADCPAVMNALGLPYDGKAPKSGQKLFTMK